MANIKQGRICCSEKKYFIINYYILSWLRLFSCQKLKNNDQLKKGGFLGGNMKRKKYHEKIIQKFKFNKIKII